MVGLFLSIRPYRGGSELLACLMGNETVSGPARHAADGGADSGLVFNFQR